MIDLPFTQQNLQQTCNQLATDTIYRQAAVDAIANTVSKIGLHDNSEVARYGATFRQHEIIDIIEGMPSAQPDSCIDSIVSEIEKTIDETKENGKHHDINVRTNGAMICFGLQLALEIIEEKRNERHNIQTGCG